MTYDRTTGELRFSREWWNTRTMPEPNTGCLLWTGAAYQLGYGRLHFAGRAGVPVHRVAFELANGPIPTGLVVCHRCDTPSCVNLDHLFIGTQQDNMRDMFSKGRANPRGTSRAARRPATVAVRELALVNRHASVASVDDVHLMRNGATLARWRQVAGVPKRRPTMALVPYNCPTPRTLEPAISGDSRLASGRDTGALLATNGWARERAS